MKQIPSPDRAAVDRARAHFEAVQLESAAAVREASRVYREAVRAYVAARRAENPRAYLRRAARELGLADTTVRDLLRDDRRRR